MTTTEYQRGIKSIRRPAINSNLLIPIFLQPDGVNLWYFNLNVFDLTEYFTLKYLRSSTFGCKDLENQSL